MGNARGALGPGRGAEQALGHVHQRADQRRRAEFERGARHAIDDAALLVLGQGGGAGIAHGEQAARAVGAHAGQQRPDRLAADRLRHAPEQHVGGGALVVLRRAVIERDAQASAATHHREMPAAWREQRASGPQLLAVGSHRDLERGDRVQALGERRAEGGGQVLHHRHRGRLRGQAGEDVGQRLGAPGRGTEGEQVRRGGWDGGGRERRGRNARQRRAARQADHARGGGGAHRARQGLAEVRQVRGGGLGQHLDRPRLEGAHGGDRAVGGGRGHHDHREGIGGHQALEQGDAVDARHFHVEGGHVRAMGLDRGQRGLGVRGGGHHLDVAGREQGLDQRAAGEGAVVDDQDADHGVATNATASTPSSVRSAVASAPEGARAHSAGVERRNSRLPP